MLFNLAKSIRIVSTNENVSYPYTKYKTKNKTFFGFLIDAHKRFVKEEEIGFLGERPR